MCYIYMFFYEGNKDYYYIRAITELQYTAIIHFHSNLNNL